jgi:hypothetical protein
VLREEIRDARNQRAFRSDDREIDGLGKRELEKTMDVVRSDFAVADPRLARRARVPGCNEHLRDQSRLRRSPREGVLASAAADDENFHDVIVPRERINAVVNDGSAACR